MEGRSVDQDRLGSSRAVEHLKSALSQGREWVPALLESMALWTLPEEVFQERRYRYLLDGEAFDWPLLAERLLEEVDGLVPQEEKRRLLMSKDVSRLVSGEELRRMLGPEKYSAYLNYWYGVVVEEALLRCVEEEERKRLRSGGRRASSEVGDQAHRRIYGLGRKELLEKFQDEKGYYPAHAMTPTETREFTYWLFKYRMKHSEGARVASDTRKGLLFLQKSRTSPR